MSAKPKSIKETLAETIRVDISGSAICTVPPAQGSPRWAYLEGQRVAERILAGIDMAPLVENKAELALHTITMMQAQRVKHPAVTYAVDVNWRAGVCSMIDAAWKAAK